MGKQGKVSQARANSRSIFEGRLVLGRAGAYCQLSVSGAVGAEICEAAVIEAAAESVDAYVNEAAEKHGNCDD